jgi:hypothetical protein
MYHVEPQQCVAACHSLELVVSSMLILPHFRLSSIFRCLCCRIDTEHVEYARSRSCECLVRGAIFTQTGSFKQFNLRSVVGVCGVVEIICSRARAWRYCSFPLGSSVFTLMDSISLEGAES